MRSLHRKKAYTTASPGAKQRRGDVSLAVGGLVILPEVKTPVRPPRTADPATSGRI
jgi:hypothetical protein